MYSRPVSRRARSIFQWAGGILLLAAVAGCEREQIRVYVVPKEQPAPAPAHAEHGGGARPHAHYTVPAGWKEVEPGVMRAARFSFPGKNGGNIDVSILPLPGITAGKLDIVNLWREQVRLEPVSEGQLDGLAEKVQIGQLQGELYDMVSAETLIEEKYKARILVAMVKDGETSWFVKMTGEDESVREQKPVFVEFLKSISFDYADHGTPVASREPAPDLKPAWDVPRNWQEVEPTQMVLAKFVVSGPSDAKAEITVSVFPGDVGGVHANVNRWRRQIGLSEVSEAELKNIVQPLDASGGGAILVDMSGENPATRAKMRLIGAIVPEGARTWFYKLTGPESVAEAEKPALIRFIQSAKHTNNG